MIIYFYRICFRTKIFYPFVKNFYQKYILDSILYFSQFMLKSSFRKKKYSKLFFINKRIFTQNEKMIDYRK